MCSKPPSRSSQTISVSRRRSFADSAGEITGKIIDSTGFEVLLEVEKAIRQKPVEQKRLTRLQEKGFESRASSTDIKRLMLIYSRRPNHCECGSEINSDAVTVTEKLEVLR